MTTQYRYIEGWVDNICFISVYLIKGIDALQVTLMPVEWKYLSYIAIVWTAIQLVKIEIWQENRICPIEYFLHTITLEKLLL